MRELDLGVWGDEYDVHCCTDGAELQQLIKSLPRLQVLGVSMLRGEAVDFSLPTLTILHINELPLSFLPDLLDSQLPALQHVCLRLRVGDTNSPLPCGFQVYRLQQLVQLGRANAPHFHFKGAVYVCGPSIPARALEVLSLLRGTALGFSCLESLGGEALLSSQAMKLTCWRVLWA